MASKPTYQELEQRVLELEQTETKLTQWRKKLQESEERLKALSEASFEAIFLSEKGICLDQNHTAERMFGYTRAEAIGRHGTEWIVPEDHEQVKINMASGYEKPYEVTAMKKDGNTFPCEIQARMTEYRGRSIRITALRDISNRKQAEEALSESEKRYKSLTNNLNIGVYRNSTGAKGEFIEANPAIVKMFGYDSREEFLKIGVSDLYKDPLERKEFTFKIAKAGSITNEILELQKKDGTGFIGSISAVAVKNKKGDIEYFDGMIEDITERKRAEEALRESEARLRSIFNTSSDAILVFNAEGALVMTNPAAARMYGYHEEEMIGLTGRDIVHPECRHLFRAFIRECSKTGQFRTESVHIRKDGSLFHVEVHGSLFEYRGVQHLLAMVRDITARNEMEKALRKSEEKYRNILESMEEGYYEVDIAGNLAFFNESLCEILGYREEELTGLNYRLYTAEEHSRRVYDTFNRVYVTGVPARELDWEVIRKDGTKRFIEVSISPRKDAEGAVTGFSGIVRDVTEQRMLESQLQRSQKMEALGLLAGGVAHDLNNILSGIVSYPELILADLPDNSPLRKPMKTIHESGMRAADVVSDLLTIARGVTTGKEALNLNTIVSEYMGSAEFQNLANINAFVHFRSEPAPHLLNMRGSPIHLEKTLMNLVINASEAIEDGGTVTISTFNRYLDEPLKGYDDVRMGEYVVLSVSDNGRGISGKDMERIFEPFYSRKVMGRSGTGLGLAVVWNTVQDHNGYIDVKTSEKGTVFELYFPVSREETADKKEEVPLKEYLGHGEKILIVDDEERQREIARALLKKLGYAAEVVSSGEEAIEYVKSNPVDLIVLDMVMPKGINGREAYNEIIKIHPGQKAVIASGYAKTKDVESAQELGAGHYIKKPYTLEKFGLAIKNELLK